jgi:DNA invertase Pin-like site-specific DNA recombinase
MGNYGCVGERFVAYSRVSTPRQTHSLAVQQACLEEFIRCSNGNAIGWFTEVQRASPTARNFAKHQPELSKALDACHRGRATLLVARLDRLTRSAALLAILLEERIRLVVAETPQISPLMLHIYAALAEEQRRTMGRRVRAGIAARRARGLLWNPHAQLCAKREQDRAKAHWAFVRPIIEEIRLGRRMGAKQVAAELNALNIPTARGSVWYPHTAYRFWHRFHRKWASRLYPGEQRCSYAGKEMRARALAHAEALRASVERYRREDCMTSADIAARLNTDGFFTATGRRWHRKMACRLLRRLNGEPV